MKASDRRRIRCGNGSLEADRDAGGAGRRAALPRAHGRASLSRRAVEDRPDRLLRGRGWQRGMACAGRLLDGGAQVRRARRMDRMEPARAVRAAAPDRQPSVRLCIKSIASRTRAMSEAFLPLELLRCWCWRIASDLTAASHPASRPPKKSPQMRRTLASPSLTISSKIACACFALVLSASIRTARLVVFRVSGKAASLPTGAPRSGERRPWRLLAAAGPFYGLSGASATPDRSCDCLFSCDGPVHERETASMYCN